MKANLGFIVRGVAGPVQGYKFLTPSARRSHAIVRKDLSAYEASIPLVVPRQYRGAYKLRWPCERTPEPHKPMPTPVHVVPNPYHVPGVKGKCPCESFRLLDTWYTNHTEVWYAWRMAAARGGISGYNYFMKNNLSRLTRGVAGLSMPPRQKFFTIWLQGEGDIEPPRSCMANPISYMSWFTYEPSPGWHYIQLRFRFFENWGSHFPNGEGEFWFRDAVDFTWKNCGARHEIYELPYHIPFGPTKPVGFWLRYWFADQKPWDIYTAAKDIYRGPMAADHNLT